MVLSLPGVRQEDTRLVSECIFSDGEESGVSDAKIGKEEPF